MRARAAADVLPLLAAHPLNPVASTSAPAAYPQGRTAYLQWREDLKKAHAATTTRLMAEAGYPEESCKWVGPAVVQLAWRCGCGCTFMLS